MSTAPKAGPEHVPAPKPVASPSSAPRGGPWSVADAKRAVEAFMGWTLDGEPAALALALQPPDRESFFRYYADLPAPSDTPNVRRYMRGMWNGDTGWTARWIADRVARRGPGGGPVRLLDAGCGFGSFAMIFAAAGAEVLGADLREDRLRVASRRLELHGMHAGAALPVRFEKADLTRGLADRYDAVWVYNAISHIDPLEPFLKTMAAQLRSDGVLLIGDINGANAAHVKRLDALRTEVHTQYVDDSGEAHSYAVERTFTPQEMRRELEANGFRIVRHELILGGLGQVPTALSGLLHAVQARALPAAHWARRQFVVATPAR